MKIKEVVSGTWTSHKDYQVFTPAPINHHWIVDDEKVNYLVSKASHKLGELNAFSALVPDVDFFTRMFVCKEATISSRIDGRQIVMEETLQKIDNINPKLKKDWQEVHNYKNTILANMKKLSQLNISTALIKHAHKLLLQDVSSKKNLPGDFRNALNWIGGYTIQEAVYVPPQPADIPDLLLDMEKFLSNNALVIPDLIKIAIVHYQFETIHPFFDGNGRIGRLLVPLCMVNKEILTQPTLYLSDFFEKNKLQYYDSLMQVRLNNDMRQWLLFFIEGILQTAEHGISTFKKIMALRQKLENHEIPKLGKKEKLAKHFLTSLYTQPIVDSGDVARGLGINTSTAIRLIDDFVKLKILHEMTGYKRNRIYFFREYVTLFK